MKYGFVTVAAAVPTVALADCAANAEAVISLAKRADGEKAALVVFPELTLTGYTCGDLFLQEHLLRSALDALDEVRRASFNLSCAIAVGLPLRHEGRLYNCAAVVHQGKIAGIVPKSHIPNYGEFYELRHFSPAPERGGEIEICGQAAPFGADLVFSSSIDPLFTFGLEICEDLWVPSSPSQRLAAEGALIIGNLSAGTETIGKAEYRRSLISMQSAKNLCAYIYSGAGEGESTTDAVFSGHSMIAENGGIMAERQPFGSESLITYQLDLERLAYERRRMNTFSPSADGRKITLPIYAENNRITRYVDPDPFVPSDSGKRAERCAAILDMQSAGLRRRLAHIHADNAVIGISGGLDSTLALIVTCRAFDSLGLDRKGITAVTMPCFGTTDRTKNNAVALCRELGVSLREVNISRAVTVHFEDIGQPMERRDVTFENGQARERTQVLMDVANQNGGIVIGTGDLSELALGWATYNGDHMSMYGVNASIPKTLVRHLVAYTAEESGEGRLRDVLLDILDTPVSPELLPPEDGNISQKTEDLVGPYRLHDFFLFNMLRCGYSPSKIFALAKKAFKDVYEDKYILHWLKVFVRRFFNQQFKRSCLPDGPKVGSVTLSPRGDWRMPSDALSASWLRELEEL